MKQGKRPTVNQRAIIEVHMNLNSNDWLVTKDTPEIMEIAHRESGKLREYRK